MSRDFRRLHVFRMADELVITVYRATSGFPASERYGLQAEIRRAAVSVVANIVEGCQRPSTKDYVRFIAISLGSASEARYLVDLAARLGYLNDVDSAVLEAAYGSLVRSLDRLVDSLRRRLGVDQFP
jgi:four helix bundle protein